MAVSRPAEARRLPAGWSGPPSSATSIGPSSRGPLWPPVLSSPPVPPTKWPPLRSTQNQPLGTLRLSAWRSQSGHRPALPVPSSGWSSSHAQRAP